MLSLPSPLHAEVFQTGGRLMVNDCLATVWSEGHREQWTGLFSAPGDVQSQSVSQQPSGKGPLDLYNTPKSEQCKVIFPP